MPKTQSRSLSSTGKQEPPSPLEYVNFKIGDRAIIKSTHPLFSSVSCTIMALPSPDAAIVELASGAREYVHLKYLEPLTNCEQNSIIPPSESDNSKAIENESQVPIGTCENIQVIENKQVKKVDVLPPIMTLAQAKQCLGRIKQLFEQARILLLEFKQRRGWEALKYPNLTACLEEYFPESRTKLVRELFAAEVEQDVLEVPIGTYLESHLRPLKKLKPTQYKQAIEQAHALAGSEKLKAFHVVCAVNDLRQDRLSSIKLFTPASLPYQLGDLALVNCNRAVTEPYAKYNGCWAIVKEVLAHSCIVWLIGLELNIHFNDLKEMGWVDETLKLVAPRVTALLQRQDLDKMEREILERYHQQQWFTPWQLQLLQMIEQLRFDLSQSNPTNVE